MHHDLSALNDPEHWLGWLGDDPAATVRGAIQRVLREQVATAQLLWIRLLDEPYYLTGGRRMLDDPDRMLITRAAVAIWFELSVTSIEGVEQLTGAFSWVAAGLDGDSRRDQIHLDLDANYEWAKKELELRIYDIDRPTGRHARQSRR